MLIKFKKPVKFEGEEYSEVDLDLDALTGNDLEKAQEILTAARKGGAGLPEFSKAYLSQVAALAAKKPVEFFRALPCYEYVRVTLAVQNFLLDGVSETEPIQ
ncbi:hypothetical protein FACS1894216_02610 [Synergistales bacterium]|nr:hypothetical protein FACS1894216_02610 [Synergistales bacterium]